MGPAAPTRAPRACRRALVRCARARGALGLVFALGLSALAVRAQAQQGPPPTSRAAAVTHAGSDGEGEGEGAVVVRGQRRRDGCVAFDGPLNAAGLPLDALDIAAERQRLHVVAGEAPGGPRPEAREHPRARVEDIARHGMLAVLRAAVRQVDRRFDRFPATTAAGVVDGVVHAQATFRSTRPLPLLGRVTETVALEVRQCPVAYTLPGEFGGATCVGRRVQLLVGPPSGWASAFVRALVLDLCFQGSAQDVAVERRWAVLGPLRSVPLVSDVQLRSQERYWSNAVLDRLAQGMYGQARLRATRYLSPRREDELPAPADPALPVPAVCAAPIAGAVRMYYGLAGGLRRGSGAWNAGLAALLHRVQGGFDTATLAGFAQARSHDEVGWLSGALALEARARAVLREALPPEQFASVEFHRAGQPAARSPERVTVITLRGMPPRERRAALERLGAAGLRDERFVTYAVDVLDRDPTLAMREGLALRLCERGWRLAALDARLERHRELEVNSCAVLRFDPTPRVLHYGFRTHELEPGHAELGRARAVRGGPDATTREAFVREVLALRGFTECAAFVRPIYWGDEPRRAR